LAINIIKKDWREYWKTIMVLTAALFVPLIFTRGHATDFSKGMMAGVLVGASYAYAYFCFAAERLRGTLQLLQGLPVRSFDLVLAKYASLYSMALFTANVPGPFLRDLHLLFMMNACILFLSTVSMAATVVSEKPWAPLAPMWGVLILFMPAGRLGAFTAVVSHATFFAVVGMTLVPVIAIGSARFYSPPWTN
jgi:hypothetical protein